MNNYIINSSTLAEIGDTIRDKSGTSESIPVPEIPKHIENVYECGKQSMVDESKLLPTTVSGNYISVDDVSEAPHNVEVKLSSDSVTDFSGVRVELHSGNIWEKNSSYVLTGTGSSATITSCNNVCGLTDSIVFSCDITSENLTYTAVGNLVYLWVVYENKNTSVSIVTNSITPTKFSAIVPYSSANGAFKRIEISQHSRWSGGTIKISNINVNIGTSEIAYEPYKEQVLTPNADGTVEGMTSVSPYMNIFTDTDGVNIEATYNKSYGMQTAYDLFWDTFQQNGERYMYNGAFSSNNWTDQTYNPKYPIIAEGSSRAGGMFNNSTKITDTRVPITIKSGSHSGLFNYCTSLKRVRKITLGDGVTITGTPFVGCSALEDIEFEGVIAFDIDFRYSPLNRASISNIIEHLSDTATEKTATFKKSAKESGFTDEEWSKLISSKSNWTISVV